MTDTDRDHIAAVKRALADPDTHSYAETAEDILRWLPADTAIKHAKALLAAEPAADMAVVPMYQPGKARGVWVYGQEVRTVHGVIFLAANRFEDPEPGAAQIPPYSWARNAAEQLAGLAVADSWTARCAADPTVHHRPGTTAHAVVRREDIAPGVPDVAVFEGF